MRRDFRLRLFPVYNQEMLKAYYRGQTLSKESKAETLTAWSAKLTERNLAAVTLLFMSWCVRLACLSISGKPTSRSAYTRKKEQLNALERREKNLVMWRHSCDKHGGNVPDFVMNDDAMLRQIME